MEVTLRAITRENWGQCIDLKVSPKQQGFVVSNLYSIAEVQFLPNFEAMAIYADDLLVGFVMFGLDEDDNNYWIYRLMVDEKYQGRGYAKAALLQVIDQVKNKPNCKELIVGYNPENIGAERTYLRVGFKPKGKAPWGEKLVSMSFENVNL